MREIEALANLNLQGTQVADLTPLAGLTGLQSLQLDLTKVRDLEPLRDLTGLVELWLAGTAVQDLDPLRGLTALHSLFLKATAVHDLGPLRDLAGLRELWLSQTAVQDLDPLRTLTGLSELFLDGTKVEDLEPLRNLAELRQIHLRASKVRDLRPPARPGEIDGKQKAVRSLSFVDTPAAEATPEPARLAAMESATLRAAATLDYLGTLPPYPEPLPWEVPQVPGDLETRTPPNPDAVPRLLLTADQRIDVDTSPATEADLADPIKEKLYDKLPDAIGRLIRFGNRYAEVLTPARELKDLTSDRFAAVDMLDIHLAVAALTDIEQGNQDRDEAERIEPDCLAAIKSVTRLGPPITMGHPDVELFEARSVDYARIRRMATVAEGERRVAAGLAQAEAITTGRTRHRAEFVAGAGDTGRVADYRASFVRNAVIALSTVSACFAGAVVDVAVGEPVLQAAEFLVLHKDAIMAVAPAWGEQGGYWAGDLIARAAALLKRLKSDE